MKIHKRMSLRELADGMGGDATLAEAYWLRTLLVEHYGDQSEPEISERDWLHFLEDAVEHAAIFGAPAWIQW